MQSETVSPPVFGKELRCLCRFLPACAEERNSRHSCCAVKDDVSDIKDPIWEPPLNQLVYAPCQPDQQAGDEPEEDLTQERTFFQCF